MAKHRAIDSKDAIWDRVAQQYVPFSIFRVRVVLEVSQLRTPEHAPPLLPALHLLALLHQEAHLERAQGRHPRLQAHLVRCLAVVHLPLRLDLEAVLAHLFGPALCFSWRATE